MRFKSALEKFDYINRTCWKIKSSIINEFIKISKDYLTNLHTEDSRDLYVTHYMMVLLHQDNDKLLAMKQMFEELRKEEISHNKTYC